MKRRILSNVCSTYSLDIQSYTHQPTRTTTTLLYVRVYMVFIWYAFLPNILKISVLDTRYDSAVKIWDYETSICHSNAMSTEVWPRAKTSTLFHGHYCRVGDCSIEYVHYTRIHLWIELAKKLVGVLKWYCSRYHHIQVKHTYTSGVREIHGK